MILYILLEASSGGYTGFIFMLVVLFVLYFFMIRPQQRRQREQKKYIEAIETGQTVVTVGGLHGKIISIDKQTLTLEIDKGTKVTIERTSISYEASKRLST